MAHLTYPVNVTQQSAISNRLLPGVTACETSDRRIVTGDTTYETSDRRIATRDTTCETSDRQVVLLDAVYSAASERWVFRSDSVGPYSLHRASYGPEADTTSLVDIDFDPAWKKRLIASFAQGAPERLAEETRAEQSLFEEKLAEERPVEKIYAEHRLVDQRIVEQKLAKERLKVHKTPSRRSQVGRGAVLNALGQIGVLLGVVGAPLIHPSQRHQDVRAGASVFLREFENVASRPAPQIGLKRTGTIELERDEAFDEVGHPITNVEENPFEVKDDAASGKSYDFTEAIKVINDDTEHPMRVLLDTGMRMNAIHLEKAQKSGVPITKYTGPWLKDAGGPAFEPLGKVDLQFYFKNYRSARTWNVEFVVLRDPPFDVALGSAFIKHANLLKRRDVVLPMASTHQSEKDRREQERMTREQDSPRGGQGLREAKEGRTL